MAKESSQKFVARNRAPRVQIEYDVELYGSEKKVQLPFVMGVLADLSGKPAEALVTVAPLLTKNPDNLSLLEAVGLARLRTGDRAGSLEAWCSAWASAVSPRARQTRLVSAVSREGQERTRQLGTMLRRPLQVEQGVLDAVPISLRQGRPLQGLDRRR